MILYEKQRKPPSHGFSMDIRAAVASENHKARLETIPVTPVVKQKESPDIQIDKTNILMLGPTGTGQYKLLYRCFWIFIFCSLLEIATGSILGIVIVTVFLKYY